MKSLISAALQQPPALAQRLVYLGWALAIFYCLYPLTNLYSEALGKQQSYHAIQVIDWIDHAIPFVDWMIVPYSWSLLLFIASFFLVRTQYQLNVLNVRIMLATLIACLCFYWLPLQFSLPRPQPAALFLNAYAFLDATDRPYNQLPSLHAAYALIFWVSLWSVVNRHTAPVYYAVIYRIVLSTVCLLIALSTLFTYQHHMLDIVAGILLALLVLAGVKKITSLLTLRFIAVGITGYIVVNIAAFFWLYRSSQIIVQWLTLYGLASCLLLAYCYQNNYLSWFGKNQQGKPSGHSWLLFAPLFMVYRLISYGRFIINRYIKQLSPSVSIIRLSVADNITLNLIATARLQPSEIRTGVFESLFQIDAQQIDFKKINNDVLVIDCTCEIDSHYSVLKQIKQSTDHVKQISYLYCPLLDLQPLQVSQFDALLNMLQQIDQTINQLKQHHESVILWLNFHCSMGWSRSVALLLCYLVYWQQLLPSEQSITKWLAVHYPHAHIKQGYISDELLQLLWQQGSLVHAKDGSHAT